MATPEEIFARFGSATRAEAEKGINNPHSDGGKKNADADAAEPVADAIHPDEEKENRTAQLQERNDPLAGETKKFLTKFLQLNNIQLSIIEGDGVLNSFFTRLGLADFTDKDTLIRGLRVLKPRYHPDRNGGGDDEKIKILNGASSWIKKSYESYHPNVSAQELSPEELLRREKAVWDAKTFEDLFAVVTSFGAVYSESFQRDVPVEEWIRRMERDRQDASSFNTRSEFFYSGWSATVTRTHGIREKFVALVSQMIDENERVFMERKTTGEKEREILVNSAKTPEELCDIVASFETIHSQTLGNTSGKKWAEGMREEFASALLYEDEDDLQMYWYSTATRTYGIREKFEALVLERVRYEKSKQKARKDAKQRIKTPNSSAEDPPLKQRRASNRSKKSADKEPVVPPVAPVNATELQKGKAQPTQEELAEAQDKERKTEERTRLVQDAKTLEELCDIVASFDTVPSIKSGDTPGGELAKWMQDLLLDSNRFIFDTYEEFEKEWKKAKKTVTKAYGIQKRFDALLRKKMELEFLEFAEPLPLVTTPEEEKESASKQQWDTFRESVKGKKSVVLASPGQKELLGINLIGDKWFDSKGNHIDGTAIREKLQNNWRLLNEEEEKAFEMGKGIDRVMETKEKGKLEDKKQEFRAQIKSLEGELNDLRAKYAKKDYEETSVWKRISRVLGRKLEPSNEENEINEKAKYQQKLQELLDVRLQLARLGREGDELKEAMAGELQYFITESKIKLYSARTEVKGTGYFEKVGNYYNDLVRKHPWVSAGIGLTLLGASFASGGAAPATLTLAVFLKRAIATPGLFVTADSILGGASAWARDRGIKKDVDKESQKTPEEMENFIKAMNADCDKALLKCKIGGRIRKSIAALLATLLLSSTVMTAYEHFTGTGIVDKVAHTQVIGSDKVADVKGATDVAKAVTENSVGAKDVVGAPSVANVPTASAYAQPSPGHFDSPSGVATEAAKNAVGVPSGVGDNIYEVSKGDTVDGLIGSYLSEHYQNFDGMTDGQKTDAINALERQLKHLSPEQLKLAGIGSGNIHSIQVEELVDLDKLFSAEDADKVMGKAANISAAAQHSIEQNNVKIAEWVKTHPGEPYLGQSLEATPSHAGAPFGQAVHERMQLPSQGAGVSPDYVPSADNSTTVTNLQEQLQKANVKIDMLHQGYEELKHLPRAENWSSQIFGIAPNESLGASTKTFNQIQNIRIFDIRNDVEIIQENRAIYGDSQEIKGVAGEKTGLLGWQLKNFTDFSNSKDGALKLSTYMSSLPYETQKQLTLGDYIKHVTPLVQKGDRLGASGLFTTSM